MFLWDLWYSGLVPGCVRLVTVGVSLLGCILKPFPLKGAFRAARAAGVGSAGVSAAAG